MTRPEAGAAAARQQLVQTLLKALLTAVKSRSFYPSGHPTVMVALRDLGGAFDAALAGSGQAVVGLIGRELVADGRPLPMDGSFVERFARELADREVEKMTFLGGARPEELEAFVETLAIPPERLGEQGGLARVLAARGVRSVQIGCFALGEQEEATDRGDTWHRARETWQQGLEGVREISERVRAGRSLHGGEAREIATLLIQGLRGQRGPMLAALTLRQKSAYTFSHSLNVSLLMLAQVEMLPLTDRQLEDVAAAGLLHDLGKLQIPEELLNKPGPPTDAEWGLLRRHPVLGVEVLGKMRDAGDLALIVAFEHHRRHDGTGYPPCRRPWPLSRVTAMSALADSYDAMRSHRPYDAGRPCELVYAQMKRLSGTAYDPALFDRFFRVIGVFPPGSLVRLSSGATGKVVRNHPVLHERPLVRIMRTASGAIPEVETNIDLSLEFERHGAEALTVCESLPDLIGEGVA
ncbi:MAG: HD-GYP domain-containing protein [Candidatus Methylomirabilia bacterium]